MPTSRKKPVVVVTRKLPDAVETRMRELFDARLNVDDKPMSQAELAEAVKTAHVLVPTVTDRIDRSLISQVGPQLQADRQLRHRRRQHRPRYRARARHHRHQHAGRADRGYRRHDHGADPGGAAPARPKAPRCSSDTQRHWTGWSPTWMLGHRIWGKRLGIIGMGRIGQAVARRAKAFGLQIHYHNRRRVSEEIEQELEATYWDSLDQMLARMDIVSVNCPHTPATYHLLSARAAEAARSRRPYVVNTARGEVIDENELARMIEAGAIAGAGLDVFEHEPAVNPEAAGERPRGGAAAHGLGDHRGPHRHGREGHHQHQDLPRRPQPARSRARGDVPGRRLGRAAANPPPQCA